MSATPANLPAESPPLLGEPQVTRWARSPHCSARRGARIRWVVLHADVSPRESSTVDWLTHPASQVSYHALVHRDGTLTRFVPDELAAWACGVSQWQGVVGLNRHTLSLAFANRHDSVERLTAAQLGRAQALVAHWRGLHRVEDVLTHAQISPGRKTDPGRIPNFRLADFR